MVKRSRVLTFVTLTYEEKRQICEHYERHAGMKQVELAEWAKKEFVLAKAPTQATISSILRKRDNYLLTEDLNRKKARVLPFPELDAALGAWALQCEAAGVDLTSAIIQEQARRFAASMNIEPAKMPGFSNGWLNAFKKRHNLKRRGNSQTVRMKIPVASSSALGALGLEGGSVDANVESQSVVAFQPLIYLTTKAIGTVQSPGVLNWERIDGNGDDDRFAIVNDGVLIFHAGNYQVNVDLRHKSQGRSGSVGGPVFKLWNRDKLLSECRVPLRSQIDSSMSVLEWEGRLQTNACLRVEFTAPGFAFHQSRLVIRRL